jgi:hypothetical protein
MCLFGPASDELLSAGFPQGDIALTQQVLRQKPEQHEFPVEALANLPKRLRDPIAVFRSRSEPDAFVALTEISHKGENIVVAVHFIPTADGKSEITDIRSIYPKNSSSVLGWIGDGVTTYYHKEKARSWLSHRIAGSNSQRAWVQLRATPNVKTNDDVVKRPGGKGPGEQGPLTAAAQEVEPQEGFYSGVAKIVNRKMPNAAPAQQVKAILKDAPAEDIKWSGVTQAIDRLAVENNGKVPKEDLLKYLQDESRVQLLEVTKRGKSVFQETGEELGTRYEQYVLPGGENYREVVLSMPGQLPKSTEYTSSHFPDVPNYVAHARMNERVDAEGKPGLFLEEIQSDRHQQAREKGYKVEGEKEPYLDWLARTGRVDSPEAIADYKREMGFEGIPDAPFRKDWHVQMFKRALRDAIAHGKEWIGWTNGETQAERYDLSKQVDKVFYSPSDNQFSVKDTHGETIIRERVESGKLADYIGKEAADRLINSPTHVTAAGTHILSGEGLKVGGEGMKGFYDNILPKEVGKYVKQWGGKVEQEQISHPGTEARIKLFWRQLCLKMENGIVAA